MDFSKGLIIPVSDKKTVKHSISTGLYGQYSKPTQSPNTFHHYKLLSDYCSMRSGDHVFFFANREIIYGGKITSKVDNDEVPAFIINGKHSPLGKKTGANLYWDERKNEHVISTPDAGIFKIENRNETVKRCIPYLINFERDESLSGNKIVSDELYIKLGQYPYPLPSNSFRSRGIVTISPFETRALLQLMSNSTQSVSPTDKSPQLNHNVSPTYCTEYTVDDDLEKTKYEAEVEAKLLSHPNRLPIDLSSGQFTLCRQTPLSPIKPQNLDRPDITVFTKNSPEQNRLPKHVIELKNKKAGKKAGIQANRYAKWVDQILDCWHDEMNIIVLAPDFTSTISSYVDNEYRDYIDFESFN